MSAVVCGKRSLFEESYPPVPNKRLRCGGGSSPVRFPLWRAGSPAGLPEGGSPQYILSGDPADQLSQLKALFPDMDDQLIEKVLEANGHDLYSTIKSLNELRLSSDGGGSTLQFPNAGTATSHSVKIAQEDAAIQPVSVEPSSAEFFIEAGAVPFDRSKWVEVFVQEMQSATSLDDAKVRATRALEAFEKVASGSFLGETQKENAVLKEQLQNVIRENHILKRAVAIQHERQVEHENCPQEIQLLKQSIAQYQEQVRTLEVNNYALNLHLRKAQEGTSMPGRFHPDVF